MLTEFFSKIAEFIMDAPPIAVLDPDEGGIMLRLGRVRRKLSPGSHYWKIPWIDKVRKTCIAEQTIDMPVQTVATQDGQTGYRGVTVDRKTVPERPYMARITYQGRHKIIGRYATAVEAARAYDGWAVKVFGDAAALNFPKVLLGNSRKTS